MPMVQYWKTKESVAAKVTRDTTGSLIMKMEGEKYHFPTFPRGHLLFGQLSKLKHEIKNQIFNDSWWKLEAGADRKKVIQDIKDKLFGEIADIAELSKYDMLPEKSMCASIKELHRAMTVIEKDFTPAQQEKFKKLKEYFCFVLQEDDGYRNRAQWIVKYFKPNWWMWMFQNPIRVFEKSLIMLEHGEVIGDMKEKIRLLRRILLLVLENEQIRNAFNRLCREIDWNKIKLSQADMYHFRGKYFKVDLDILEY